MRKQIDWSVPDGRGVGAEASSGAFRSISDGISRPARQQACSALLHGWGRVSVGR